MALAGYNGQDEFGGHSFLTDTGAELYVPDSPEAQRYAAMLQSAPPALEARGPGRSALGLSPFSGQSGPAETPRSELDAGVSRVFEQYGAPPSAPALPTSQAPVVQQGPGGPVVAKQYTPGAAPAAAPARPAAPMLPGVSVGGTGETPAEGDPGALSPAEEASIYRQSAGSPGVSQAQLQAKAAQGVAVPTGSSFETSGAVPQNPEIEAAWVGAKKAEYEAQQRIAEANVAAADTAELKAVVDQFHHQDQLERQQMQIAKLKAEADHKHQIVQDFDQEAQARYADFGPDRFFKRKGTWATIGAAIMMGIGEYAKIVSGGSQNSAMQIIQNAQNLDVEEQRNEYMRDKDARNNLVADIARATGDIDVATEAAKAIQLNIAAAHAGEMAALSKRADVGNNWQLFQAQFQAGVVDHMQKAYERGLGNTVIKQTAAVQYPKAASGGGPITIEQLAKREEAAARVAEARRKRAPGTGGEQGLTYEQRGKVAEVGAETSAREKAKKQSELSESASALSSTLQGVARMRELSGVKSRIGIGKLGTSEYEEGQSIVEDTRLGFAKIKTGGVVTESDKKNAAAVIPDITSMVERGGTKLDALEKRAKQEFINKVRAVDPRARNKKPSQILMEAGVRASPDEDKVLE